MATVTLSDILDDLQAAETGLHRFERRYWVSTEDFIELYAQGLLDDGENLEDFAEWAGHHKLRQKRLAALEKISEQRLASLPRTEGADAVRVLPAEPGLELA